MAGKSNPKVYGDAELDADRPPVPDWHRSAGTYIAGRAYVDEADLTACDMERKWGVDRLRLLVPTDLREKFDRQRFLFNQAIWTGDLETVKREAGRMVKAWLALDRVATDAGATRHPPEVWEVAMPNGSVAAIVRDNDGARAVQADGRAMQVFTLAEVARLLAGFPALAKAKDTFPGCEVVGAQMRGDPLDGLETGPQLIDQEIPF